MEKQEGIRTQKELAQQRKLLDQVHADSTCGGCPLYDPKTEETGECHRHAPAPKLGTAPNPDEKKAPPPDTYVFWPVVQAEAIRCGDVGRRVKHPEGSQAKAKPKKGDDKGDGGDADK